MPANEVNRAAIGVVRKPHGVRGGLKVTLFSIDLDTLRSLKQLFVKMGNNWKQLTLKSSQGYDDFAILSFNEISDRTEAVLYRGQEIFTNHDELPDLEDGEWYIEDLVGCEVVDENKKLLGKVVDILTPGAHEVLVVKHGDIETLVPLVDEWVTDINTNTKCIQINSVEEVK